MIRYVQGDAEYGAFGCVSLEKVACSFVHSLQALIWTILNKHDALADARWNRELHRWLQKLELG